MFISFIIPAYNVESYIERCIESICNQNFSIHLYEVIVVNDGSTDNTLSIIKSLIAKYQGHKIILIDKPNGGLSSARNIGISQATGKYVWFVDSDDYIANNCLEHIYQNIQKYNELDVFAFNMIYIYDNGSSNKNNRRLPVGRYITGSELFLKDFRYPYSGVQFAIYKQSYLQSLHLNFKEGIFFEDILYTTTLMASNPKCVFVDKIYYHYYIRTGSITNSKSSIKKCLDILSVADELNKLTGHEGHYNHIVLYNQIARLLPSIYRYRLHGLSIKETLYVLQNICYRKYWLKSIIVSKKYKYFPYLFLNYTVRLLLHICV